VDSIRKLRKEQLCEFIEQIDALNPSLKDDVKGLAALLPGLIKDGLLPMQKLKLEVLSERQILSGEHTHQPLRVLLEYCKDSMNSHYVYQQDVASNLWAKQCYIAAEITQPSGEQGYQASHESDVIKPHPMECLALTLQESKYHTDSYVGLLGIAPHQLQLEATVNTTSNFSDEYTISHTPTNPFSNSSSAANESQNLNVLAQPASRRHLPRPYTKISMLPSLPK
jgi:hypothetical protein